MVVKNRYVYQRQFSDFIFFTTAVYRDSRATLITGGGSASFLLPAHNSSLEEAVSESWKFLGMCPFLEETVFSVFQQV